MNEIICAGYGFDRVSEGVAQNREPGPGGPEGEISMKSYALGMELIGFVRGWPE